MNLPLRRDSPLPLYHQIAEAIRNAIAVGHLAPGDALPSVREGADAWDVNLHTVRRAYGELAREGLVTLSRRGTCVTSPETAAKEPETVDGLISTFVREASERFGLTEIQLGQMLLRRAAAAWPVPVYFLECSHEQAAGHCAEIRGMWQVDVRPLVLGTIGELPSGVVLSTYFHYNDVRQRWPDRVEDVRFVAIAPDPALASSLPVPEREQGPRRLLVCELEEAKAANIAADLRVLVPPELYRVEPCVLASPASLPRRRREDVVLVAPRVWAGMPEGSRAEVGLIRYLLRSYEMDALGKSFGWARKTGERVA